MGSGFPRPGDPAKLIPEVQVQAGLAALPRLCAATRMATLGTYGYPFEPSSLGLAATDRTLQDFIQCSFYS